METIGQEQRENAEQEQMGSAVTEQKEAACCHVTNNFNYACPEPPKGDGKGEKRPSGWKRFFKLLLILVILFFLGGCGAIIAGCVSIFEGITEDITDDTKTVETTVLHGIQGNPTIAVIDVKGVIGSESGKGFACSRRIVELIEYVAENIADYKALIIDMDTPGGEVIAADEVHTALRKLKKKNEAFPIVTCMHSMGASGGYYIAAGTDYIVANRMTFTGSIGVIMASYNVTGLMGKIGVEEQVFCSGAMKDMMSPTRAMREDERSYMKQMVDSTFNEFAKIVADGRSAYKSAEEVKAAPFGDGRVLSGAEALKFKLIDELGDFDTAVDTAAKMAGIEGARCVVRLSVDYGFWSSLSEMSEQLPLQGRLFSGKVAVMKAGQPYFLMPSTAL